MTTVFPIYRYPAEDDRQLGLAETSGQINLSSSFLRRVETVWGTPGFGPEDIIYYAYAVFHSPGYRSRYADLLKIDFPRFPLAKNVELFRALARLGGDLVGLHLMELPELDTPVTTYLGLANPVVEISSAQVAPSGSIKHRRAASGASRKRCGTFTSGAIRFARNGSRTG